MQYNTKTCPTLWRIKPEILCLEEPATPQNNIPEKNTSEYSLPGNLDLS